MFFKNRILEFQYQLSLLKINNYIYMCVCVGQVAQSV